MSEYWKQTYSTLKYDFVENDPATVSIVDIANSLAQIPRFNGHLKRPLSVAQHCLTVAAAMQKDGFEKKVCLDALMHDSHEAYGFGDISSPYKRYLKDIHGVDVNKIELPIKKAIEEKYNVNIVESHPKIKEYDLAVLRTEAESLFERPADNWTHKIDHKLQDKIKTILGVKDAKDMFISTFKNLGGKL